MGRSAHPLIISALGLFSTFIAHADVCETCHGGPGGHPDWTHGGGVAGCDACHTMHNSQGGSPVDPEHPGGNAYLLRASTASDVCLICHTGFMGNVFGSDPLNPPPEVGAGNFVFLLEDNLNDGHGGGAHPIPGEAAGHSIVAPSRNVGPDATLHRSPGGDFPSESLGCTSCHDPHGNRNYRMLYGAGRTVQAGLYTFDHAAPEASGLSIFHGQETNLHHAAYNSGVSAWCGNCHGEFHDNQTDFVHPSGNPIGPDVAGIYNDYDGTDDPFGGTPGLAYLALVPYEDLAVTITTRSGPGPTSQVMCLSCHRAHASSAPDAGRWDFAVTFLSDDGVESGSYPIPDPYSSPNQRSLCNKCHVKDWDDAPREGPWSSVSEVLSAPSNPPQARP